MKKYIGVVFICLGIINANAQDKFSLGVKVGQNFSNVNSVAVDHNTASYHGGVSLRFGINEKLGIAPEILLSQTKLETNPSIVDVMGNNNLQPETYHLNYLSIPLLVEFKPVNSFAIQAGPQYSILLDQKKDGIGNATMAFKSGEFAFVGGAKLDLGGFFLYGRYIVGLQNINELQDQAKWKTTQWQLGVGMSLLKF